MRSASRTEVNLLGGMLDQEDTMSLSGIPGLAQIPILKYLFSQKSTEVKNEETVFALVPHIVRRKQLDEFKRRTLDVGTANPIRLRRTDRDLREGFWKVRAPYGR